MIAPEPAPDPIIIGKAVLALKARLAPRGSVRERVLRTLTRPLVRMLLRRYKIGLDGEIPGIPVPEVVRWHGIQERALALPARPRILILKLDHIGDFIVGMPAIAHLRAAFPDASMTLVCASWNRPWAERTGWFDEVVAFNLFTQRNADWGGTTPEQFAEFAQLGLSGFDLAIDLRHDTDTRPLLAMAGANFRAGFCAPYAQGGAELDIALPDVEHISQRQGNGLSLHAELRLMLLAMTVTATFLPQPAHPAALLLTGAPPPVQPPYMILAPGAGSPIRVWPMERLIEIGRRLLAATDAALVITGGPAEAEAAAAVAAALPEARVHNLCGAMPLADLPDLVRACSLYVGYDTGSTHLAAALGVPTVALLTGVPNLEVWYPLGRNVQVVASRIACSPCYFKVAAQCPYGVPCLDAISVDAVWTACTDALADSGLLIPQRAAA
ncbi:glycosyltransferase family 9 protein [Rhodopila sp.]|uniref:glycosyltransferase family 9 protein n=1 Tax=Rhodopila sp. TaxID=2480087 RepID=UPI002CC26E6F|nr:glycosyltransferase family 9 protein [Rhodopila sp.]HVZ10617.1 glycosyltransferase family 9 protein [Rhodopila sp.]